MSKHPFNVDDAVKVANPTQAHISFKNALGTVTQTFNHGKVMAGLRDLVTVEISGEPERFHFSELELSTLPVTASKPARCPDPGCNHTDEGHRAFDEGLAAGEKNGLDDRCPYDWKTQNNLAEAWMTGQSAGACSHRAVELEPKPKAPKATQPKTTAKTEAPQGVATMLEKNAALMGMTVEQLKTIPVFKNGALVRNSTQRGNPSWPMSDWLLPFTLLKVAEKRGSGGETSYRVQDVSNPRRGPEKRGGWWVSATALRGAAAKVVTR